jgi:Predicted membrane protein
MFSLISTIVSFVLLSIDGALGIYDADVGMGLLSGIYLLAIILPLLGLAIRRLHDTGRSGWWLLISIIPLIGTITLWFFTVWIARQKKINMG